MSRFGLYRSPVAVMLVIMTLLLGGCQDKSGSNGFAIRAESPASSILDCSHDTSAATQGMPSEERIFGWIEELVAIGDRRTGTPSGQLAAAYVKCQFTKLGLENVHYETATSWSWHANKSSLGINGIPIDSSPIRFSFVTKGEPSQFSTGPDGLTAEIVDVGRGTLLGLGLHDVKGKIVLFNLAFQLPPAGLAPFMEFLWDPGLTVIEPSFFRGNPFLNNLESIAKAAMKAGAVGFVGVLADYFNSNKFGNEFYRRTAITIPGFWVSGKDGAHIRKMMAASKAPPMATLHMTGSREEAVARTVVGFLPGKSKDAIMVQSHHDSVFSGAIEDASGVSEVLALAQYFASQPPESREKTLMFATFDSHFTGYQQHMAFVKKYITNKATPYNIVANVTLEHIAKQGKMDADGNLVILNRPEIRAVFETLGPLLTTSLIGTIVNHDLRRTAVLHSNVLCPLGALPTDASFICKAGVPTASFISGPVYMYDAADTLDKVYRDGLVPVAKAFIDLVKAIDKTPSALIGLPVVPDLLGDVVSGLGL